MQKPIKKIVLSMMASTMILSQLSMTSVMASGENFEIEDESLLTTEMSTDSVSIETEGVYEEESKPVVSDKSEELEIDELNYEDNIDELDLTDEYKSDDTIIEDNNTLSETINREDSKKQKMSGEELLKSEIINETVDSDLHTFDYDDNEYDSLGYEDDLEYIESLGKIEVNVSTNEFELDEEVHFSVYIENADAIDFTDLLLLSNSGKSEYVYLDYNRRTGLFEGTFEYNTRYFSLNSDRTFTVDELGIYGKDANYFILDNQHFDASNADIELVNIDVHEEIPEINLDTINIKETELSNLGVYEIEVEVNSDVNDLFVEVEFNSTNWSWSYLILEQVNDSNIYRGYTRFSWEGEDVYTVDTIRARDMYGNEAYVSRHENDYLKDLSIEYKMDKLFTVDVSESELSIGESSTASLDLGELSSEINEVLITYVSDSYNYKYVYAYYSEETGRFEGDFHFRPGSIGAEGENLYTVSSIELYSYSYGGTNIYGDLIDKSSGSITLNTEGLGDTAPEIDITSLTVDKNKIIGMGSVLFSIDATSDIGIEYVRVTYENEFGDSFTSYLYEEENGQFVEVIDFYNFDKNLSDSIYSLKSIEAMDKYGNKTILNSNEHDLSAGSINVQGIGEIVATVSSQEIKANETVKLFIDLDLVEGVNYIRAWYFSESGSGTWHDLHYNEESGLYEGEFKYDTDIYFLNDDREFSLDYIRIFHEDGPIQNIYYQDINIDQASIKLVGTDPYYAEAELDLNSLSISQNTFEERGTASITMQAASESGLRYIDLSYVNDEGQEYNVMLRRFKNSDLYTGSFRVYDYYSEESTVTWTLEQIEAVDDFGNRTTINNKQETVDLTHMNIEVHYSDRDYTYPDDIILKAETFSLSNTNASTGDTIEYSVKAENMDAADILLMAINHEEIFQQKIIEFAFDESSDRFVANIVIDDAWLDGNWTFSYFFSYDSNQDYVNAFFDDYDLVDLASETLTIYDNQSIPEAPIVKLNSLNVSASEVSPGDILTFTADIDISYDGVMNRLMLNYYHDQIELFYNEDSGLYEGEIEVAQYMGFGEREFLSLIYLDQFWNHGVAEVVNESNIKGDFLIKEEEISDDFILPEVDFSTLVMSKDILKLGESTSIAVSVSPQEEVRSVSIGFNHDISYEYLEIELIHNSSTNNFEAVIDTKDLKSGLWTVSNIDVLGNSYHGNNFYSRYSSDDYTKLLKTLDFMLLSEIYVPEEVEIEDGWHMTDEGEKYFVDGEFLTGKRKVGQTTYLFDSNGLKQTGWHQLDGKDYYFDPQFGGGMVTGKRQIGQTTYLMHNDGYKTYGWHRLDGKDYYFDPQFGGGMVTGKRQIGQTTYLMHNDGYKTYGWHRLDGKDYYFDADFGGGMVTGKRQIGQTTYLMHNDGHKIYGWALLDGKTYYFDPNYGGGMITGERTVGTTRYLFDSTGARVRIIQS